MADETPAKKAPAKKAVKDPWEGVKTMGEYRERQAELRKKQR